MSPIKRHSFCLYFYLHHFEIVSHKAVIATTAMLFLIKYLLLRASLHLLNLIHLPAQSAQRKTLENMGRQWSIFASFCLL